MCGFYNIFGDMMMVLNGFMDIWMAKLCLQGLLEQNKRFGEISTVLAF